MKDYDLLWYALIGLAITIVMLYIYRDNKINRANAFQPDNKTFYWLRQLRPILLISLGIMITIVCLIKFINS